MKDHRVRFFLVLLAAGFAWFPSGVAFSQEGTTEAQKQSSCEWCHGQLGGEYAKPVEAFRNDVHHRHGYTCSDCHGGDPKAGFDGDAEAAMNPRKGYIGVPKGREAVRVCARCHSDIGYMRAEKPGLPTDQERLYHTSVHGKRLLQGDTKVAVCSSCHRAHGVLPPTDPESSVYPARVAETCGACHENPEVMAEYGIPTDQVEKWKRSVHGVAMLEKNDLGAPTCNDCHGNHGAAPPGISSISRVCGQCHPANDQYFQESPHKAAYEALGIAECEFCHGNHEVKRTSDEMVGVGGEAVCVRCHEEGSKGYRAAAEIRASIDSLRTMIASVEAMAERADRAGGFVEEIRFDIQQATTSLLRARTLVHTFDPQRVKEEVGNGLKTIQEARQAAVATLRELQKRRMGLGAFLVIVVGLILLLVEKIRQVDRRVQDT